ncbi:hypothetical protein HON22_02450 [Candidatus Peregrinibacteria bacterium]|jgi:hypothetical protein|nr:hypothetical protein [Candidatus Peregrinibacteria bacterium]
MKYKPIVMALMCALFHPAYAYDEDEEAESLCESNGRAQLFHAGRTIHDPLQKPALDTELNLNLKSECDLAFPTVIEVRWKEMKEKSSIDLKQLYVLQEYELGNWFMELKLGRQFLNAGVSDFLLLNSHQLPFNWVGVFTGRNYDDWQKPEDRFKFSLQHDTMGKLSLVAGKFVPSDIPQGRKMSYFHPFLGTLTNQEMDTEKRQDEPEFSLKYEKTIFGSSFVLYGYKGFYKSPLGIKSSSMKFYYPQVESAGFSIEYGSSMAIFRMESVYLNSVEDPKETDPFIPDSQVRYLISAEKEVISGIMISSQFYEELPQGDSTDENIWTATLGLRAMFFSDKLTFSAFYAQEEEVQGEIEQYLRGSLSYKFTDFIEGRIGGNTFKGKPNGRFGQFRKANNAYAELNYYFNF